MNPATEIGLIVGRELRKNVRSAKGGILLALSILGATATTLNLKKFEIEALNDPSVTPEMVNAAKLKAFSQIYDEDAAAVLVGAPVKLVILFFMAVWLAPLFITVMGFDGVSGELQHRSVRYWMVRTRRSSYFIGKFFGLFSIVAIATLMMHSFIWIATLAKGDATVADTLSWGLRFWATSLPITAAWCGLATLIASQFRTPNLALIATGGAFFLIFFFGKVLAAKESLASLGYMYPSSYDAWMLSGKTDRALIGLAVCLGIAALSTAAGTLLFARRDV